MNYDDELKRIQEMAIEHAIEEMNKSDELGVSDKTSRGDRGFLTGMASKSLGVAVRIEQFMALRRGGNPDDPEEQKSENDAKQRLVGTARAEVGKIMERIGVGNKPRR